jgi:hypothetical protein
MSYNKLILKTNAAIEIEQTISYYCSINTGLAIKLEKEILSSFKAISKNPESFQNRYFKVRIFWLDKFPYMYIIFGRMKKCLFWLFGIIKKIFQINYHRL